MSAATAPPLSDVLDDPQADVLGQVEHLTRLAALQPLGVGETAVAGTAAPRLMRDPLVRHRHALQMRALMTLLAALLRPEERRRLRFLESALGLA